MSRVEFRLLGTVEAFVGGRAVDLGPARQRCVLTALLVDVNHVVLVDHLLDRVWGDQRPYRARGALHSYLSRLRKTMTSAENVVIARQSGGYIMTADPAAVDLHCFHRLVAQARASENDKLAAALFEQALGLWRGDAFATLDTAWLNQLRTTLEAERRAAELDRNDLELRLGRHYELLAELCTRAARHPLDERLTGQVMLALYRSGRKAEALRVYRNTRTTLVDELGLEPGPELGELHRRILAADADLATPAPANAKVRAELGPVPRQLPVDVVHFTGRERYLDDLHSLVDEAAADGSSVAIAAIDGTAGVGKTALAIHFGHRVADRFPDGLLYIDLRGYAPTSPVTSAEALGWMLRSLGQPPEQIPADEHEQAALYRSVVAGKRVLVVLDNARSAAQVQPLLPASPDCLVMVTSRTTLTTLDGATTYLHLDVLSEQEASTLLARLSGPDRMQAEPEAAATLVSLCARLPLAVRIAGARLAARPTWTVSNLIDRLADEQVRLDELRIGDRAVRASFAVTYDALKTSNDPIDQRAAHMFRHLGVLDWVEMSVPVAAALLDQPEPHAYGALERLLDAHLLSSASPGRYHTHDLLRLYARDEALHGEPEPDRQAALLRALHCYLAAAEHATLLLTSLAHEVSAVPTQPPQGGFALSTPVEVAGWIHAERANLLAAARQAATTPGTAALAVQLAAALSRPFEIRSYWREVATLCELAARTAQRLGDRRGEASAREDLGFVYTRIGRTGEAITAAREALVAWREIGDRHGEANCLKFLGFAYFEEQRLDEAITCHQQALAICRDVGYRYGEAGALNALGLDHQRLMRLDEAVAYHHQALAINRNITKHYGEASVLGNLGWAHHRAGRSDHAIACQQQALILARNMGNRYQEAESLWGLGEAHHTLGQHDRARTCWQHSITILHDIGAITGDETSAMRHQPIPDKPNIIQRNT